VIVADASVILEIILATSDGLLLAHRLRPAVVLHAPHLLDLEVAQVLRRLLSRSQITEAQARRSLQTLPELPIERYPHLPLLPRIWELRSNLTAYDAAYLSLAEILEMPLWTRDGRLSRAPGIQAEVVVV
jgi:predicted nucleic acid-binding protein